MAYVPPLNGGRINATIAGNTAGVGALVSTGTLTLAGGNNITLSQNGNALSISAPTQTNQTLSFSAGSQSTLTATGTFDARSMFINGVGGVKVGFSQSSVFISSPVQSVETQSIGMLGGGAGATSGTSGNATGGQLAYNFYAGANVTLSQSLNGASASLTVQGGAGAGAFSAGISTVGNTSGNTGLANNRLVFSGGNNITLSQVTGAGGSNTLGISAPNISSLSGTGAVSLSSNGNTISVGAPVMTLGMNTSTAGGATGGGSTTASNGLMLVAGSNITLSQTTNASGAQVSIYAGGGGAFSAGISTVGNTSGNTGLAGNQVVFSGGNNITLSQVTGAGGSNTLGISGPVISSLTGAGVITISSNGSTVSVSAPAQASHYIHNSAALGTAASTISSFAQTSLSIVRMLIPQHLSFTRVDMPISVNVSTSATANTAAMAISSVGVIYSRSGSTLNPIIGQSANTTYSFNSNNTGSVTGPKLVSFGLATSLSAGEYYFGVQLSTANSSVGTATTAGGWSVSMALGTSYNAAPWTDFGAGTASTANGINIMQGVGSVSLSATGQTVQQSQVTQYGATGVRANLIVGFKNN